MNDRLLALIGEALGLDEEERAALRDADPPFVAALLLRADEADMTDLVESLSRVLNRGGDALDLPFPSTADSQDSLVDTWDAEAEHLTPV